jgi:hypothetical protein
MFSGGNGRGMTGKTARNLGNERKSLNDSDAAQLIRDAKG